MEGHAQMSDSEPKHFGLAAIKAQGRQALQRASEAEDQAHGLHMQAESMFRTGHECRQKTFKFLAAARHCEKTGDMDGAASHKKTYDDLCAKLQQCDELGETKSLRAGHLLKQAVKDRRQAERFAEEVAELVSQRAEWRNERRAEAL